MDSQNMLITLRILILALLSTAFALDCAHADELIIDDLQVEDTFIGDFNCSVGRYQSRSSFKLIPGQETITAGELWQYFDSQGIHSLKSLTLLLDIDTTTVTEDLDFDCVEFCITDSNNSSMLTSFSLDGNGDNSLVVPGYQASSFRPEAQLKIDLGFDFMKEFSKDSTNTIVLNVQMNGESKAAPLFSIASNDNYYSIPGPVTLVLFAAFWIGVFVVLFRITNPATRTKSKTTASF